MIDRRNFLQALSHARRFARVAMQSNMQPTIATTMKRSSSSSSLNFQVPGSYDYSKPTCVNYRDDQADFIGPYRSIRASRDHEYHLKYTVERQAMQDRMIADVVNGGVSQTRPWLVFTAGPMAAGKGHVIRWLSREGHFQLPSIVQIDPDCFRSRLPEWDMYRAADIKSAGARTHKECGLCVEIAQEVSLMSCKNAWVDGSLRDSQWYQHVIRDVRARHPSYQIGIIYVYASEATIMSRSARREMLTGRHVPSEELLSSIAQVPKAVNDLSSMADFVAWISNDVNPPKLVKFCDETSCRLLPGTEWEEIRSRFAPIEVDDADRGKEIDDLVAFNKVVLFTKTYCSYCSEVKSLFRDLGQEVATFDLDARSDGLAIQLALNAKTGVATTPQVFVGGEFLGGNSDVFEKYRDGSLESMLCAAEDKEHAHSASPTARQAHA